MIAVASGSCSEDLGHAGADRRREVELVRLWPHLKKRGAGRANRIPQTFEGAIFRAKRPRRRPSPVAVAKLTAAVRRCPRPWVPILRKLLALAEE